MMSMSPMVKVGDNKESVVVDDDDDDDDDDVRNLKCLWSLSSSISNRPLLWPLLY
jgi:hypothetical protein